MGKTAYKKLTLPDYSASNWYETINNNFRIIDSELQVLNANVMNQLIAGSVDVIEGTKYDQCVGTCELNAGNAISTFNFNLNKTYTQGIDKLYCEVSLMSVDKSATPIIMTPCICDYTVKASIIEGATDQLQVVIEVSNIPADITLKCILKAYLPQE